MYILSRTVVQLLRSSGQIIAFDTWCPSLMHSFSVISANIAMSYSAKS